MPNYCNQSTVRINPRKTVEESLELYGNDTTLPSLVSWKWGDIYVGNKDDYWTIQHATGANEKAIRLQFDGDDEDIAFYASVNPSHELIFAWGDKHDESCKVFVRFSNRTRG